MRGRASIVLAVLAMACSKSEDPFVIAARGPLAAAPFGGSPAITRVELRVRDAAGSEKVHGSVAAASGGFEVPNSAKGGIGAIVLAGLGDDGAVLAYGRTPLLELEGLAGTPTHPLAILVQRAGTLAPSVALEGPLGAPRCAMVGARFAVIGDAGSTRADVVDLLDLAAHREEAFEQAPITIATAGAKLLVIDAGGATLMDLDDGTRSKPVAPEGTAFADVAGGAAIVDDKGGTWIVGATRTGAPTDVVLHLAPDGAIAARRLAARRSGAAATFVRGRGVVVAYGGGGVELIGEGTTSLPYPAAASRGVLAPIGGDAVLHIDEAGTVTRLDLACTAACAPAATTLRDEPRGPRADDHATAEETGSAIVTRGGRILRVSADAIEPLDDVRDAAVCSMLLPTGSVAVAVAGERALRTASPRR